MKSGNVLRHALFFRLFRGEGKYWGLLFLLDFIVQVFKLCFLLSAYMTYGVIWLTVLLPVRTFKKNVRKKLTNKGKAS